MHLTVPVRWAKLNYFFGPFRGFCCWLIASEIRLCTSEGALVVQRFLLAFADDLQIIYFVVAPGRCQ